MDYSASNQAWCITCAYFNLRRYVSAWEILTKIIQYRNFSQHVCYRQNDGLKYNLFITRGHNIIALFIARNIPLFFVIVVMLTAGKPVYERLGNSDTGIWVLITWSPRGGASLHTTNQQFIFQYLPTSATAVWRYCKTSNNQLPRSKAFASRHYCLDSSLGALFIYPVALIGPNPSRPRDSLSACPLIIPPVSWKWNFMNWRRGSRP